MSGYEKRPAQVARVYAELRKWHPRETPLWALHNLKPRISDITTRLYELRHQYHVEITNRMERARGDVHSFYRITKDSVEAAQAFGCREVLPAIDRPSLALPEQPVTAATANESLFADIAQERLYPD